MLGKGSKGVTPLIAAILLIAATMTLAGVLAWWASGYVKNNVPSMNATQQACQNSDLSIFNCSYDHVSSQITISLHNTGTESLSNLNAFVFDATGSSGSAIPLGESIDSGSFKSYLINGVKSDFTQIVISSPTCPQLSQSNSCSSRS